MADRGQCSYLSMNRFVRNVGVLFEPRALIVFAAVTLPVSQAHPTEIEFARKALHVVASAVFLDANIALITMKFQLKF